MIFQKEGDFFMEFKTSETRLNLLRAFAGESQARNRYTFAASEAKKQNLNVIERLFTFTANQEKEHAELFYKALKECSGENIEICGSYPIDISTNIVDLLKSAAHNEFEEHNPVYSGFSKIAEEEGFPTISTLFPQIAEIEKTHGDRFAHFKELLEQGKLFSNENETKWLCLNCGHIHSAKDAPNVCPVCQHDQGYFIRYNEFIVRL